MAARSAASSEKGNFHESGPGAGVRSLALLCSPERLAGRPKGLALVQRVEFLEFIGANGAGKSATIKNVTGNFEAHLFCRISKIPQDNRQDYVKDIGVVFGRTQLWEWIRLCKRDLRFWKILWCAGLAFKSADFEWSFCLENLSKDLWDSHH